MHTGEGFGKCGAGYIRISAFNNFENVREAMERIGQALASLIIVTACLEGPLFACLCPNLLDLKKRVC